MPLISDLAANLGFLAAQITTHNLNWTGQGKLALHATALAEARGTRPDTLDTNTPRPSVGRPKGKFLSTDKNSKRAGPEKFTPAAGSPTPLTTAWWRSSRASSKR